MLCYRKLDSRALFYGLVILIMIISLGVNAETSIYARPKVSTEKHDINESKEMIKEIKSAPPFVNIVKERSWRYKNDGTENADEVIEDQGLVEADLGWLLGVANIVSIVIEFIFWMTPLFLGWYLYKHRTYWLAFIDKKKVDKNTSTLPETLFGLDVRRDKLPENIEHYAQKLWSNNQKRDAVSLLYRGALVFLFDSYRFSLPSGATEHDCLRYIEIHNEFNANSRENSQFLSDVSEDLKVKEQLKIKQFKCLTDVWIKLAYAHKLPSDEEFNVIVNGWNSFFETSENKSKI